MKHTPGPWYWDSEGLGSKDVLVFGKGYPFEMTSTANKNLIAAAKKREEDAIAAKAQAELLAKQEKEKAEREAKEALERAEREKQEAIEAERRKAQEEADRIRREGEAKEAARLAEEKRIKDEEERRAQDKAHRKEVNNKILADLLKAGASEEVAKSIITAIVKGEVFATRITY